MSRFPVLLSQSRLVGRICSAGYFKSCIINYLSSHSRLLVQKQLQTFKNVGCWNYQLNKTISYKKIHDRFMTSYDNTYNSVRLSMTWHKLVGHQDTFIFLWLTLTPSWSVQLRYFLRSSVRETQVCKPWLKENKSKFGCPDKKFLNWRDAGTEYLWVFINK